jgi:hypothetical protein
VETPGVNCKPTLSAYESPKLRIFLKIAYKPRTALKFRTFLVVPIYVPGAAVSAKLAKFEPAGDISVLSRPFGAGLKKNYCSFQLFIHFFLFLV